MDDGVIGTVCGLIGLVGFIVIHGVMGLVLWVVFAAMLSLGGASEGAGSAVDSGGVGAFLAFLIALSFVLLGG
tara:strand:+ start:15505 stop:15723 length:219 start_codon:yes stop_codon:yes gene_type:complete